MAKSKLQIRHPESNDGRKLVAIMFTDMVGYTVLSQKNEQLAIQLLEQHRRILRPIFKKNRGIEIDTVGDAFLVVFSSALDAVNCALEIQNLLTKLNENRPEETKIRLRIGIHLGDVLHKGDKISGDAVNVASRIEPLAQPGGVCLTAQVYYSVINKIQCKFESLGNPHLKNVSIPLEVFRISGYGSEVQTKEERIFSRNRIAVLPFANMSRDYRDEYFADGMTEEVISTISKISGLQVIARTSTARYKGGSKSIDEIGKELKVGTVLEGSVRKAHDKLRIAVQLIDSNTSEHIWSESYNRELNDIFTVQGDIAKTVAGALQVTLLSKEKERIEKPLTNNPLAYAVCLKGIYHNVNASTESDLRRSLRFFEKAIELDARFALAYSWLSDCYSTLVLAGYMSPKDAIPKAERAIRKSLEIDPDLADAHRVLGFLLTMSSRPNWVEAELETKRALNINPNVAAGHESYAWILGYLGRLDEALYEAKKGFELDPLSPTTYRTIAHVQYFSRRYDESIEQLNKMQDLIPEDKGIPIGLGTCYLLKGQFDLAIEEFSKTLDPSKGKSDLALYYLALVYARSGRIKDAKKILIDFEEISSKNQIYIPAAMIAQIQVALGEKDEAIHSLEKAYDEGESASLLDLKVSPLWDDIRPDPRFISLLKKIGLEH